MPITGLIAKVYACPYIKATTIAANDVGANDTYTDTGNGFIIAGFQAGDSITVSGFTTSGNNGVKTIATVVAGTMTLSGATLTGEIVGDEVTIIKNVPGTLIGSCSGWSLDQIGNTEDITNFSNTISPTITDVTIAFGDNGSSPDTITDTLNRFIDMGFCIGDHVKVSGSTTSDGTYVVSDVAAGTLSIPTASFPSTEAAGDTVTLTANSITANTIAFVDGAGDPDTITDSGNGFVTAGFDDGDTISIIGSTSNNIGCIVSDVAAGVLTVPTGTLTAEDAGDTVTIKHVRNWKVHKATSKQWTAALTKFWATDSQPLFGVPRRYEFFIKYYASPSESDVCYYFEGIGVATGITTEMRVLEVMKTPITIQGIATLTPSTRTTAW